MPKKHTRQKATLYGVPAGGLGFGVQSLGFRVCLGVQGLGFRVWGLGFAWGFRVWGSEFGV